MAEVTDFIDQVINQDFASAAPTFKDIMGDIVNQSLEQEKVKLADQMFNGAQIEPDVTEIELDDLDDVELDAGAEEALEIDDDEIEDEDIEEFEDEEEFENEDS